MASSTSSESSASRTTATDSCLLPLRSSPDALGDGSAGNVPRFGGGGKYVAGATIAWGVLLILFVGGLLDLSTGRGGPVSARSLGCECLEASGGRGGAMVSGRRGGRPGPFSASGPVSWRLPLENPIVRGSRYGLGADDSVFLSIAGIRGVFRVLSRLSRDDDGPSLEKPKLRGSRNESERSG